MNALNLNRRQLLRMSAGSLLAAGLWPGALFARDASDEPFHFIAVNDLHYFDKKCQPWFEKLIRQIKELKERPQFCLVVGDLTEDGTPAQLEPIRELLKGLSMSVRVVVGNHDHRTQTDRQPYEDSFPNSINYHFTHGGWQFVGIDTSDGTKSQTSASATTLRWLDDELPKLDKQRPTVLFTHFPLGPLTPMRVKNADEVLGRFKEFNLQAVYNGHFHGFTERTVGKVTVTTNRCCSFHRQNHDRTKEKGFFVCQAKDGKITRTFVEAML